VRSITALAPLGAGLEGGKLYILARELLAALEECRLGVLGEWSRFERFDGERGVSSASNVSWDEEKCSVMDLCCLAGAFRMVSGTASFRFPLPWDLPPRSVAEGCVAAFIYYWGSIKRNAGGADFDRRTTFHGDDFDLSSTFIAETLSPRASR
jgi:hypothetical protein